LVLTGKGSKTLEKGGLPEGTQIHVDLMAFTKALLQDQV
jgi:D-glycero-D-manno-heptose 1,7-bisphosphate phosphatase